MSNQPNAPLPDTFDTAVAQNCADAGLEVMEQIIGILFNRETVAPEALVALSPGDIQDLYFTFVDPAIDRIEDGLLGD